MSMKAAIAALGAVVVLLSLPALLRAPRIARLHRQLGPAAWPFIVAADAAQRCQFALQRAARATIPC